MKGRNTHKREANISRRKGCWRLSSYLISSIAVLSLLYTVDLKAQETRLVNGVVLDASNKQPLSGVAIRVEGANKGESTDVQGKFSVNVKNGDVLVFSHLGYERQEKVVESSASLMILLSQTESTLDEVVVIGYGEVKKSDFTGAVGQVKMSEIVKAPVASFEEALAGRIAGVQVSAPDGQPGEALDIVIRGASSLTQSNSPLYVIDGFPVEDSDNLTLSVEDIASINVLKDASATAIYGSRGANGVIIIETKQGQLGEPQFELNSSLGFQLLRKPVEVMDPYEFVRYQLEFNEPSATERYLSTDTTLDTYRNVKGVNWQKELFRDAIMHKHNASISGGTNQTRYFLSASLLNRDGIIPNSGLDRFQTRLSIDQTLKDNFKVGVNINYSDLESHGQLISAGDGSLGTRSFLFWRAWGFRPVLGVNAVDEEGDLLDLIELERDPLAPGTGINPLVAATNIQRTNTTSSLSINGYVTYSFGNGFRLKITGGRRINQIESSDFYNSKVVDPLSTRGVHGSVNNATSHAWSNENTLNYTSRIGSHHRINALAGFSLQGNSRSNNGYNAQQLPNEQLGLNGLDEGSPYALRFTGGSHALLSFYGRFNYDFASKYLLTTTLRGDGSSKFPTENRWGYFPSAAVAWNMHNERFMQRVAWISQSKFRLSYGLTGNNRVGEYSYFPSLTVPITYAYSFNNATPTIGLDATNLGNSALKWETTQQLDIGWDLGLFKNKIEVTVDYYNKYTTDMLLSAELPQSIGYASAFKNIGKMKNQGWEVSLNTINISGPHFKWNSSFNISFNRNKIVELTNSQEELLVRTPFESQYNMPLYISSIGKPAGQFYGHIFDGLYQYADFNNPSDGVYVLKEDVPSNGLARNLIQPGDIKYKDINGDGVVNADDRTFLGAGMPKHIGGFINNFEYKGFDLSLFFQWSYGNKIYNANRLILEGNTTSITNSNQFASYIDRWSPDNQGSRNFRVGGAGPITHSSRVLEDGSYLRLKTFSVGYSLQNHLVRKIGVQSLRVHASAQNLLTWTRYSGLDPEVSVRNSVLTPGFDFSAYPQAKTVTFGINATF